MTSHDPERAYVQFMLDHADNLLDDARESMRADLDRLAVEWRSGLEIQRAEHEQRMAKMRDDRAAWLRSLYSDPTDPQQEPQGTSGATPAGMAPAGPPTPLTADDIKAMSLDEFRALRERMGMGNASGRGLLG